MGTFLFGQPVFGPVKSRRLGISLGINLSPTLSKWCNYNCLYCECGWNPDKTESKPRLPSFDEVTESLRTKLSEMTKLGEKPDVITFSGNGEPSMHPDFFSIVSETIAIRDELCADARIAVLSNASLLHKPPVFDALRMVDDPILKLDSGTEKLSKIINQPAYPFSIEKHLEGLRKFQGDFILQSIFLRGTYKDEYFDNTTDEELSLWLEHIQSLKPRKVMIYSLDRETPHPDLEKVSSDELVKIAESVKALGFEVQIA